MERDVELRNQGQGLVHGQQAEKHTSCGLAHTWRRSEKDGGGTWKQATPPCMVLEVLEGSKEWLPAYPINPRVHLIFIKLAETYLPTFYNKGTEPPVEDSGAQQV